MPESRSYPWFCPLCGASGHAHTGNHDVCDVIYAMGDEHAKLSPTCKGGRNDLRCLPRIGEHKERWILMGADLDLADRERGESE